MCSHRRQCSYQRRESLGPSCWWKVGEDGGWKTGEVVPVCWGQGPMGHLANGVHLGAATRQGSPPHSVCRAHTLSCLECGCSWRIVSVSAWSCASAWPTFGAHHERPFFFLKQIQNNTHDEVQAGCLWKKATSPNFFSGTDG